MAYHIGIELSPSYFKLAEVKRKRGGISLQQYVVHPFPGVWSKDASFLEREELIQTIQEALLGRELHTERVHVGISCHEVVFKRVTVPEMGKRKYRKWIEQHLLPVLDLPFPDPVFDYQLVDHVWADGDEQEILLALISKSYIDTLTKVLRYCGLDPTHIDLAPFSLFRWINASKEIGSARTAILQISKTEVEASFFVDGKFTDIRSFHLPLTFFLDGEDRPHPDPLKPVLLEESEVARYGRALFSRLTEWIEATGKNRFLKPGAQWILTGEGLDLYLLEHWLNQQTEAAVSVAPPAELVMTERLKEVASRWVGSSLSVPLGLVLKEGEVLET
jgi:type IV pilus assembly protein PilM